MKKYFILLVVPFVNHHLFAQTALPAGKPQKTGNEWKMPGDAVGRAQSFADKLKKGIGLDDATAQKIFGTYLDNTKSVDEIPLLPITDQEKKQRLKANRVAFDEKIKEILSPVQFTKYKEIEDNQNAR